MVSISVDTVGTAGSLWEKGLSNYFLAAAGLPR